MAEITQMQAALRGTSVFGNVERDATNNSLVAQGGAPYTEMARTGGIWNVMSAAVAPLVAIPTTTAIMEIFNNSGATSTPFVMEVVDLFLFHLLGTAAQHNLSIWAQVTTTKAAPTVGALAINSQSGRGLYTSTQSTRIITAASTTVIATGWRPWGQPGPGAVSTALPGEAFSVSVEGKYYVPPGCSLCLQSVDALATASSVQLGAAWNERVLSASNVIG